VKVKEPKQYLYIDTIQENIFERRIAAESSMMKKRKVLAADDPRRIAPNLASKPAPSTSQLVAQHKSRLSQQNSRSEIKSFHFISFVYQ
jgi:hypothetical protein